MIDKLSSYLCRIFFIIALVFLCIAVLDKFLYLFGWKLSFAYQPGRMLEFSVMLMTFVIALLLRQIREYLKNK